MRPFWRRVRALARNELIHILREPRTLLLAFGQPITLVILYGYCISFDLHHLPFAVWDQDRSEDSRRLVARLAAAGPGEQGRWECTFDLQGQVEREDEIEPLLSRGRVRFVLAIPRGFARQVGAGRAAAIQALIDAADANTAAVAAGYLTQAVARYNLETAMQVIERRHGRKLFAKDAAPALAGATRLAEPIAVRWRVFYNPDLSSRRYIVPGLIAILLTFMTAVLTATTIVRERELGTLESLLTAPIGPVDLVIGKLAPYILVAAVDVTLVVAVSGFVFGNWPRGDLLTLSSFTLIFLLGNLAIGMLISSFAPNQYMALVLALLINMLPNFLLTGFAFPRNNMPFVLQVISFPLPATQYLICIRGVFLKGVGWSVLWPQGLYMTMTTGVLLSMAIRIAGKRLLRGLE